jgi:hypothetical protein
MTVPRHPQFLPPQPPLSANAIEITTPYAQDAATADVQRSAVAANAFRVLQNQGHIPREARLGDTPLGEGTGVGVQGTYRERLEALVTDRDRNGRFDLDLDRLNGSGVVQGAPGADRLERALAAGVPMGRLPDQFVREQHDRGPTHARGTIDNNDRALQRASGNITFARANQTLNPWAADERGTIAERVRAGGAPEADRIASDSINRAQIMQNRGDGAMARRLLDRSSAELQEAGQFGAARRVNAELARAPHGDAPVNLVQAQRDTMVQRPGERAYNPRADVISIRGGGNTTEISEDSFQSTYGRLARTRDDQMALAERMRTPELTARLGHTPDPRNVEDARAYFHDYARTHSGSAVRDEYATYLRTNFVHAGQGVSWDALTPRDERPQQIDGLLAHQPVDGSGRRIVDCEGFTYITHRIFDGMPNGAGGQYRVAHAGTREHVISAVGDGRGEGFVVNNASVTPVSEGFRNGHDVERALQSGLGRPPASDYRSGLHPSDTVFPGGYDPL